MSWSHVSLQILSLLHNLCPVVREAGLCWSLLPALSECFINICWVLWMTHLCLKFSLNSWGGSADRPCKQPLETLWSCPGSVRGSSQPCRKESVSWYALVALSTEGAQKMLVHSVCTFLSVSAIVYLLLLLFLTHHSGLSHLIRSECDLEQVLKPCILDFSSHLYKAAVVVALTHLPCWTIVSAHWDDASKMPRECDTE